MKLHTRPLRSWGRRWPPPIRCCRFPKILHFNLLRNQPNIKLRILLINHTDHTEFASYVPPFIPDFQVCKKDCQLNFRDSNFHSSNHTGTTLDKNQQLRTIAPIKRNCVSFITLLKKMHILLIKISFHHAANANF